MMPEIVTGEWGAAVTHVEGVEAALALTLGDSGGKSFEVRVGESLHCMKRLFWAILVAQRKSLRLLEKPELPQAHAGELGMVMVIQMTP